MFNFTDWSLYLLFKILSSIAIYYAITGSIYYLLWIKYRQRIIHKKIQSHPLQKSDLKREIHWSFFTNIFSGIMVTFIYWAQQKGLTKIYLNIEEYGLIYFFLSILLIIIINDTYFYWIHRLSHRSNFLYKFHRIHHQSHNPNPITSQSQHPIEFLIFSLFFPLLIFLMPLHPLALFGFKIISSIVNLIGHSGYEFFPPGFTKGKITGHILTSTHHNMHHQFQNNNFGLYFSLWDRIMKSHHNNYHKHFEEIAGK